MADTKKEQERDELHRAIWAIADDRQSAEFSKNYVQLFSKKHLQKTLRRAVDGWDFKNYVLGTMFYRYMDLPSGKVALFYRVLCRK